MDEFSTMEALSQRANATPQNRIRMAEPMPVMTPDTASSAGPLITGVASSSNVPADMSAAPAAGVFFEMYVLNSRWSVMPANNRHSPNTTMETRNGSDAWLPYMPVT